MTNGIDNSNEKGRVLLVALATLGAMAGTAMVTDQFRLGWIWHWIYGQPLWLGLVAALLIWGGVMLALTRAPSILRFVFRTAFWRGPASVAALARALASAARSIARSALAFRPIVAAIGRILEPFYLGFLMVAQPLLAPFAPVFAPVRAGCRKIGTGLRILWLTIVPPLLERAALARERSAKEWMLRRAYRDEFRGKFSSYREFKRAFHDKSESSGARQESRPAVDAFPHACGVMGLPLDGQFSEAAFKVRYRELMKTIHPDIGGPNKRAALVNAASDVIKSRKGWS